MKNLYRSSNDIETKLHGSFVRYDGTVVSVVSASSKILKLSYSPPGVSGTKIIEVNPADPLLDISAIDIGYVNIPDLSNSGKILSVSFFSRKSHKQYKQGTAPSNVVSTTIDGEKPGSPSSYLGTDYVFRQLNGEYPKLSELVGVKAAALSKDVAVQFLPTGQLLVYYRTRLISCVNLGSNGKPAIHTLTTKVPQWVTEKVLNNVEIG